MPRRSQARTKNPPAEPRQAKAIVPSLLERRGFLFILIGFLLLALLLLDPKPFLGGNNATYIILARSILSGQGYCDLSAPGTRHLHPAYQTPLTRRF